MSRGASRTEIRNGWTVGHKIRTAREHLGLSVREAAERAGIGATSWGNIETGWNYTAGSTRPTSGSASTLTIISNVVGLDSAEILREAGMAGHAPIESPLTNPTISQRALLARYGELTEDHRRIVIAVVEGLLAKQAADSAAMR